MKKVYTILLSGAALLAVAACNKEVQVEEKLQNNEPVYETLSVKVGAETKVTLETGAAKSTFEENDKIAVWTDAGAFQALTVDAEGKITVDVTQPRSNYAVYYNGATIPTYSAGTLSINLPDTYAYDDVAGNKNPVPMVAKNVHEDAADMTFYAVGTLFRVTVKAIPSNATRLIFQFPGNKVNGTFQVTNPGTSTPSIATGAPDNSGEDKITVTFASGTANAENNYTLTLNIPLPTGAYDDVYITPVGGETKVASARHIKAGGYTAARAHGRQLTATLVSFSVSASKKVIFAPGNLQYKASPTSWRFAENQYDRVGKLGVDSKSRGYGNVYENSVQCSNELISDKYNGWIDLFGWGTSGWSGSGVTSWINYQPWATDNANHWITGGSGTPEDPYTYNSTFENNVYGYGPGYPNSLTGTYAKGDWGVYNQIGDYSAGTWRTPTASGNTDGEWDYLLFYRENCNEKWGRGRVADADGLIILPDSFEDPKTNSSAKFGPAFKPYTAFIDSETLKGYYNQYDESGWKAMESAGAIFLPCAGKRQGTEVSSIDNAYGYGYYWSSSAGGDNESAYRLLFRSDFIGLAHKSRYNGFSVRLVRDL